MCQVPAPAADPAVQRDQDSPVRKELSSAQVSRKLFGRIWGPPAQLKTTTRGCAVPVAGSRTARAISAAPFAAAGAGAAAAAMAAPPVSVMASAGTAASQ